MKKIVINQRTDDYQALIEGEPDKWGCGRTPDEAVGNLVRTWPREFNIEGSTLT